MQHAIETTEHQYFVLIDEPEPEPDDAPELAARWEQKLRAFKRPDAVSLIEAARRGLRWAVLRVASLARPVTSTAGPALTQADKRFLAWLANAAVALYLSENQSTVEG